MPSVRVDERMFADPRFDALGKLAGLDADAVRWRMVKVFRHCAEFAVSSVPALLLDHLLGVEGAGEYVMAAGLGRPNGSGIYICGAQEIVDRVISLRERSARGGNQTKNRFRKPAVPPRARRLDKPRAKRGPIGLPGGPLQLSLVPGSSAPKEQAAKPVQIPEPAPEPPRQRQASKLREATELVVADFNRRFNRSMKASGWEKSVERVLAKGFNVTEIRGVLWWAGEEWRDNEDMRRRVCPTTLLKFQSSAGYRTFPEYLSLATELWHDVHPGKPCPWEKDDEETSRSAAASDGAHATL